MRSNRSIRSRRPVFAAALAATGCAEPAPSGVVEAADDPALAEALPADEGAIDFSLQTTGSPATLAEQQVVMAYESCTFNGVTYRPLVTRLEPADVYRSGDGVCQFTESCGSGANWSSCKPNREQCP